MMCRASLVMEQVKMMTKLMMCVIWYVLIQEMGLKQEQEMGIDLEQEAVQSQQVHLTLEGAWRILIYVLSMEQEVWLKLFSQIRGYLCGRLVLLHWTETG